MMSFRAAEYFWELSAWEGIAYQFGHAPGQNVEKATRYIDKQAVVAQCSSCLLLAFAIGHQFLQMVTSRAMQQ